MMTTSLTVPTFTRQHNKWRGCKEANDIHSAKIDKCIKGAVLHRARMGQATAAINNFNSCTTALTTPAVWETAKTCKIMWRKSVERFPRYPLKTTFFVPGFDLQPSKGPNMSSVWICCKSVQRLLRYLPKIPFFLSEVTLAFKLVQVRDQTRFPYEFGAKLYSSSRDISHTNKNVTYTAKNRTLHSSLHVVIKFLDVFWLPNNVVWRSLQFSYFHVALREYKITPTLLRYLWLFHTLKKIRRGTEPDFRETIHKIWFFHYYY